MLEQTGSRLAAFGLLLFAPLSGAHHSWDPSRGTPIEWQGRIERVSWDGPHVMYRIRVPDGEQQVRSWQALGASPRILRGRGIRQSTLTAGDAITVIGHLDPFNQTIALKYLVTAAGHRYEMGFSPQRTVPAR